MRLLYITTVVVPLFCLAALAGISLTEFGDKKVITNTPEVAETAHAEGAHAPEHSAEKK